MKREFIMILQKYKIKKGVKTTWEKSKLIRKGLKISL